jgi:hypothetical protein
LAEQAPLRTWNVIGNALAAARQTGTLALASQLTSVRLS